MVKLPISDKTRNIQSQAIESNGVDEATLEKKRTPYHFLLLIVCAALGAGLWMGQEEDSTSSIIVLDQDGNVELSPERKAKLARELDEIDNAEQYALIAAVNGHFPCFSCMDGSTTIFLKKGEVWKYGVTRKGEQIRYPAGNFGAMDLYYVPQFKGDYAACLKEEKRKIYYYPTLPEALMRSVELIRPPGNKTDS
ncbi:hypothetical protein [Phaeodactylibacter sp.]|jgi:hypothetical protein|uniref:hypothetical protein n=1 Tax=Phaeodactylibacter sp. TaxID=1940289 RepID=UPI0025E5A58F|nr:hypothetical protein [Phaeodactylibacter sp.]MCI4647593.1 hypothetical protein [Phaeodactylibacter sp.]MCI5094062.1 hypothetical protein [Phaeodactylibacter sp.]